MESNIHNLVYDYEQAQIAALAHKNKLVKHLQQLLANNSYFSQFFKPGVEGKNWMPLDAIGMSFTITDSRNDELSVEEISACGRLYLGPTSRSDLKSLSSEEIILFARELDKALTLLVVTEQLA